jgi:serine protease
VLNYENAFGGHPSWEQLNTAAEEEWNVVVKSGTSDQQITAMCKANRNGCNLVGHPSKGGVPFFEMRGTEKDLERVLQMGEGAVKFVEPDSTVSMIPEIEADNVEAATWGLNRVGADQRSRSGGSATVFVLDTGVRHSHNDFTGRASGALDMTEGEPKECNGDLSCAGDVQGHGTHCAGTAAGDSFGVAPAAQVKSVKVLSDQGSGSWSWSYYALDWLATNPTRPAIASMSLGGSGTQQAMRDAVDGAVNSGVVVVVAGGNSNKDACKFSPAFVPSAITVGSTTSTDTRSSFSNYGACTNIWAPGSNVVSASHTSDTGSTSLSGTSMACPHVSGGAALVLDADPSMKPSAVLQSLQDSAATNYVKGLYSSDLNKLLNVGAGGAPPPGNVPPGADPPAGECSSFCQPAWCAYTFCSGCSFC